jgi:hypothetical protein
VEVQAKKISVSIPSPLLDDLQYLSARLGVSRSALITELLGEALPVVAGLLRMVPEGASPDEAKRFRGASVNIIRERVAEAQRLADEYEADVIARAAGEVATDPKWDDARAGVAWWNGLTEAERAVWCHKAGSSVPAHAWACFKFVGGAA